MKWETQATLFAGVAGLLAGCGLVPSGIGFAVVFVAVGTWAIFVRRQERRGKLLRMHLPKHSHTYWTVIGRIEVSRPTARVFGALSLGLGIGLAGHLLALW
ncbi:MAG TPA: hypothetical protein VGO36_07800 [Solirubrobacterales bacterium]|jgi:hypothetical protein|nr:hypothetical protein [Solirubrobacterales bacterium]